MSYCKAVSIPVNFCCSTNKQSKESPRDQYLLNLNLQSKTFFGPSKGDLLVTRGFQKSSSHVRGEDLVVCVSLSWRPY